MIENQLNLIREFGFVHNCMKLMLKQNRIDAKNRPFFDDFQKKEHSRVVTRWFNKQTL